MIYQTRHTNNHNKKILIKFFWVGTFLTFFILFTPLRSIVLDYLSPFFQNGDSLNKIFFQIPKIFVDKNNLIKENEKLAIEIERLNVASLDYYLLNEENKRLSKELGFLKPPDFFGGKILARSPQIALDTIFIDQGRASGANEGSLVLAGERVLIGRITKISKNRAVVTLNSFPGVVSYGFVERTGELLEIRGEGGGNMRVEVPIDFDIQIGDKVVAEGSKDSLLAIVGSVEENLSSGFKKTLLSMPINISKTRVIFVASDPVLFNE